MEGRSKVRSSRSLDQLADEQVADIRAGPVLARLESQCVGADALSQQVARPGCLTAGDCLSMSRERAVFGMARSMLEQVAQAEWPAVHKRIETEPAVSDERQRGGGHPGSREASSRDRRWIGAGRCHAIVGPGRRWRGHQGIWRPPPPPTPPAWAGRASGSVHRAGPPRQRQPEHDARERLQVEAATTFGKRNGYCTGPSPRNEP